MADGGKRRYPVCEDKYEGTYKVGEGVYGEVFKGVSLETREVVALKHIRFGSVEEGVPSSAVREISVLKQIRHPNLVRCLDFFYTDKRLTLVFEFMEQDLTKKINEFRGNLPVFQIKSFLYQLVRGLAYCHQRHILHRDLKPANLLINRKGELKLADFGLARTFGIPERPFSIEVVTLLYRAPEVLLGCTNYTTAIDMWSTGCIFAEMVSGKPLFPGRDDNDQLLKIFSMMGSPTKVTWPTMDQCPGYRADLPVLKPRNVRTLVNRLDDKGFALLMEMLKYDPAKRITAQAAMGHPFFADLDKKLFAAA